MRRLLLFLLCLPALAAAQSSAPPDLNPLRQLNDAISGLIGRVGPSVVEIEVHGFGAVQSPGAADLVIGPQQAVGAGFVIDPAGYIVTNAHVVRGGTSFEVVLPQPEGMKPLIGLGQPSRRLQARLIGVADDIDLAVLKVDGVPLPALPLASYGDLQQGEMVFAFGSPGGLSNSVSMGVVSATARQSDPNSPMDYIQTDAAINPGNSGGPLVNVNGEVVGVDTFILSQSGGNEGLGFALPSNVVRVSFEQIEKFGHVHRAEIGAEVQSVTPTLAAALHLARDSGLILADIDPGSPADQAGLHIGDELVSVNGRAMTSVPEFMFFMMSQENGAQLQVQILRGQQPLALTVTARMPPHPIDALMEAADPVASRVPALGILGVDFSPALAAQVGALRIPRGVLVIAHAAGYTGNVALLVNDLICSINQQPVNTLADLRAALAALPPGSPVALQVLRAGQLVYLPFTLGGA